MRHTAEGAAEEAGASQTDGTGGYQYLANTNSKVFHYPDCGSGQKTAEHNREYWNGSREELINMGYRPCKNCNP
ncbi:MAG: hypothetical protein HUJ73_03740 [Eubacterium sp.]|nr:hypothetical protein [Eubacterium sp.]